MVNSEKAFPNMTNQTGMDLRDYFAAKAMQGNIAACPTGDYLDIGLCAKWAYDMADAMMKARGTKPNEYQTQSTPTGGQPADPSSW